MPRQWLFCIHTTHSYNVLHAVCVLACLLISLHKYTYSYHAPYVAPLQYEGFAKDKIIPVYHVMAHIFYYIQSAHSHAALWITNSVFFFVIGNIHIFFFFFSISIHISIVSQVALGSIHAIRMSKTLTSTLCFSVVSWVKKSAKEKKNT